MNYIWLYQCWKKKFVTPQKFVITKSKEYYSISVLDLITYICPKPNYFLTMYVIQ